MTDARTLTGTGVGRGTAVAPAVFISPAPVVPDAEPAGDPEVEVARVKRIMSEVGANLRSQAEAASGTLADVLAAASTMAEDPALASEITSAIEAGSGPATAVDTAVDHFAEMFRAAGGYLAERVTDLMSVRHRIIARILGVPEPGVPDLTEPKIIIAEDLSPADTAALNLELVAGIVTELGGPTSHTAIIAGQLGIPCLVGVSGILACPQESIIGINAVTGTAFINPSDPQRQALLVQAQKLAEIEQQTGPSATKDGHAVDVLANIGTVADAVRAREAGVSGVGLFRTEILFLSRQSAPDQDEQAATYESVFAEFPGQKVVTRTLDAGADKPLAFATLADEENPALGVRGYRISRLHPELLTAQLAALARAEKARDVDLWVMAPMISTAQEAREFASAAREAGINTVGVMIEVPSAALRAEQVLTEVDFLSIGTNDLAQYTMAADRLSSQLLDLTDKWHPAILELIEIAAAAGKKLDKPVGVCGESAGDPLMALVLTGLGITSLSMAPPAAVIVKYMLQQHTLAACKEMADAALKAPDATAARVAVQNLIEPEARAILGL